MTDISKDAQYYLQNHPAIMELVTSPYIGEDDAWVNGWIFDSNLQVRQENTQRCAIVVSYGGGYATLVDDTSAAFPAIIVDIWADPTRNEDLSPTTNDAKTKCFTIHDAVRKALHLSEHNGPYYFNQTRVVSSELTAEPVLTPVIDGNGAMMLRARYGISLF